MSVGPSVPERDSRKWGGASAAWPGYRRMARNPAAGKSLVFFIKSLKKQAFSISPDLRWRDLGCLLLLVGTASCVPVASASESVRPNLGAALVSRVAADPQAAPAGTPPAAPEPLALESVSALDAPAINAAIPIAAGPVERPTSIVFRAESDSDQQRSLQCLTQAIYYEARSESEDGQRAVAQVVLNRVRHPAFPKSVCGVVYQGPLRAGGGCQFTFTCDGSMAIGASGSAWDRARTIAAQALAGSVFAPVGYATSYHTQNVVPVWAYRLVKSAVIGAHIFYRMPGAWGEPGAFRSYYAGREPAPSMIVAARAPILSAQPAPLLEVAMRQNYRQAAALPAATLSDDRLPDTQVRAEFRTSGQWLAQPGDTAIR